jgi:hypothetical protein
MRHSISSLESSVFSWRSYHRCHDDKNSWFRKVNICSDTFVLSLKSIEKVLTLRWWKICRICISSTLSQSPNRSEKELIGIKAWSVIVFASESCVYIKKYISFLTKSTGRLYNWDNILSANSIYITYKRYKLILIQDISLRIFIKRNVYASKSITEYRNSGKIQKYITELFFMRSW